MKNTLPAPCLPVLSQSSIIKCTDITLEDHNTRPHVTNPYTSVDFGRQKDLPIRGRAQGGDDGNLIIEEQPIDWTYRPADLQGVHEAFAVFVTGDSMEPKYKDQDLAYIHPTQPARRRRYVLVETVDHHSFIKQFVRWDKETLVLQQFNPEKNILIPREMVRKILMVIGSLDA
ncbi:MAG: helix-turn-helix transcriptional regulator [Kordiimonadaceae bacterium]|nr:helix-turn-helix transcriptional regulator [Kordiimonadaceae bacterium]